MATSQELLDAEVFTDGRYTRFGDITADSAKRRSHELRAAIGWGPTSRVAPVARSWNELARVTSTRGAHSVSQLDEDIVALYAARLWIVPPGGTLLPS